MRSSASFCGDASRGRGHPARTGTSVPGRDLYPLPGGHSAPTGTSPSHRRHSRPTGDTSFLPGTSRAYGDRNPVLDGVECLRRRGTPLWAVPPQIEDVPFDRGLRSPTGSDDRAPVVWGRSTSWAENAVPDGPGRPCGAVVETGQSRPRACWSALPIWGCAARRAGPAARRRRRDRSGQVRDGRHNLMAASTTGGGACIDCQDRPARLPGGVSTAGTGARCPRWARRRSRGTPA